MKLPQPHVEDVGEAAGVWMTPSVTESGRVHYTILLRKEPPDNRGLWRCSCPAEQFGNVCRHIKEAKEQLRDD